MIAPDTPAAADATPAMPHPMPRVTGPFDGYDDIPPDLPAVEDDQAGFGDYDFEEEAREREALYHDLASDNDDFARSDEEGWYYSDDD